MTETRPLDPQTLQVIARRLDTLADSAYDKAARMHETDDELYYAGRADALREQAQWVRRQMGEVRGG